MFLRASSWRSANRPPPPRRERHTQVGIAGHVIWVEVAQARARPVVAILAEVRAGLAAIDRVGEVITSITRRLFPRRDDLRTK